MQEAQDEQTVKLGSVEQEREGLVVPSFESNDGQVIDGRYLILEKLGSGGMSTVFKARHLLLNKNFALKLLHKSKDQSALLRFQQEAKASSILEHPNIVRVHDFGISDGSPYMIMDYLEGKPLSQIIKEGGALPLSRLIRIFSQVAAALSHAHEQGVVHRDIKPSNIMIIGEPGAEQAVIVDFGIAKLIDDSTAREADASNPLTRTGDIFGTPYYMSPEQCLGQPVDARSDIYSLACVMYESAVGKPPFQGDSVYHLIHQQITEAPDRFPESARKTRQGRQLEATILKGMAKAPSDRHKFVLELASELKSIELGAGGVWSDISSTFKVMGGRLKATERQARLTKSALEAGSCLALILALVLFLLPEQIKSNQSEALRNKEIIDNCNLIYTGRLESKSRFWLIPIDKELKYLKRICKRDPAQFKAFQKFNNDVRSSAPYSNRIQDCVDSLENELVHGANPDMLTVRKSFLNLIPAFKGVVNTWASSGSSCSTLLNMSMVAEEQAKQRVQIFQVLQVSSLILASLIELLLLVALLRRVGELKQAKEALAQSAYQPAKE